MFLDQNETFRLVRTLFFLINPFEVAPNVTDFLVSSQNGEHWNGVHRQVKNRR